MTNVPATPEVAEQTRATPAELVSAAAAGQPALIRIARTNMLRAISRMSYAVDRPALPAPAAIRFGVRPQEVALDFDSFAEATAWAQEFRVADAGKFSESIGPDGGRWCIYTAYTVWRGFRVTLAACVLAAAEQPVSA